MTGPVLIVGVGANYLKPGEGIEIRARLEEMVGCKVVIITQCTALAVVPGDTE